MIPLRMMKRHISKHSYRIGRYSKERWYMWPIMNPWKHLSLVFVFVPNTDCELVMINRLFLMTYDQRWGWEEGLVKLTDTGYDCERVKQIGPCGNSTCNLILINCIRKQTPLSRSKLTKQFSSKCDSGLVGITV